ncbi:hypothetical protein PILCRDRAFT_132795 [Piloderma croceum F 1598]|uniref:Uncharacterized protein n=1 Tax=Piloderma croceum (strain F 1598) TaxID=765440 RepID=A0A0C3BYD2_PILCF|nr:hypothetical protein PILCRDRAFT_132795 [Piloderma croceum F 1598]
MQKEARAGVQAAASEGPAPACSEFAPLGVHVWGVPVWGLDDLSGADSTPFGDANRTKSEVLITILMQAEILKVSAVIAVIQKHCRVRATRRVRNTGLVVWTRDPCHSIV